MPALILLISRLLIGTPCELVPYLLSLLVVNMAQPLTSVDSAASISADLIMIVIARKICSTLAVILGNCNVQCSLALT